jgi:hypothetical protein
MALAEFWPGAEAALTELQLVTNAAPTEAALAELRLSTETELPSRAVLLAALLHLRDNSHGDGRNRAATIDDDPLMS